MDKSFEETVNLAQEIVENGGEIARAEESVMRILTRQGAESIQVFIIPSFLSVSAMYNGKPISATRRIYKNDLNLGRLEVANNLSRKRSGESHVDEKIDYHYPLWVRVIGVLLATASFCLYFGGSVVDAFFSFLAGLALIGAVSGFSALTLFTKTFIQAAIAGVLAFLPAVFSLNVHPDKIMIGAIMLMIPGMSIGISMKDMLCGDLIAGILELLQAFLMAFAIAFGFAFALLLFGSDYIA